MKYKDTKKFKKKELEQLFLSVKWKSGQYPKKLKKAMENSDTVISAWDDGKLVGLMNAISDGSMNVYFPYLLIHPHYQGFGIGKTIVKKMLKVYEDIIEKGLPVIMTNLDFMKNSVLKQKMADSLSQ